MNSDFSIATIINFCSNDYPFLRACIDGAKPFSRQILVPICDHFFDGVREEREVLQAIYAEHTDVQFLEFPWGGDQSLYSAHPSYYWHNLARMIGRFFVEDAIDWVLLLDCDEIVDGKALMQWLRRFAYRDYNAISLCNYWYFRESYFQAKSWEHTPLMVKKELLKGALLMNENERCGILEMISEKKLKKATGLDGKPMVHHYSWVRTKEQMLRKAMSWGHSRDRDWVSLIEEEFSRSFNGTDFVNGYEFTSVPPFCKIDLSQKPMASADAFYSHVRQLKAAEVMAVDVSLTFDIPLNLSH